MKYSSPLRRLIAFAIDCLTVIGIYFLLGFILGLSMFLSPLTSLPILGLWFYGGIFASAWLYYALLESSALQGTVGKIVMGIRVVDLKGKRIGFWRASARYFCKLISRMILMIGFLMVFFTKKKQALHDKMAGCLVIKINSSRS